MIFATYSFYNITLLFSHLNIGPQSGYISFNHNATNLKDSIHVTGTGIDSNNVPIFTSNVMSLDFGNVNNGMLKRDSVAITNTGTANLIISSVSSSNNIFVISPVGGTVLPKASMKFYITFIPTASGVQTGYIRFNHNSTNMKDSIYVTGSGVSSNITPIFTANTNSLNYGAVKTGNLKIDSVLITNTGTSNLTITDIVSNDNTFTITTKSGTISPGASLKFFIIFAPITEATSTSNIIFTSNAGRDTIRVTGTGQKANLVENIPGNITVLSLNYPNPFEISTNIKYNLQNSGLVSLKVFDVNSILIATLVNNFQEAGIHIITFTDISNSSLSGSGVYFYQLIVGPLVLTKQMMLIK